MKIVLLTGYNLKSVFEENMTKFRESLHEKGLDHLVLFRFCMDSMTLYVREFIVNELIILQLLQLQQKH